MIILSLFLSLVTFSINSQAHPFDGIWKGSGITYDTNKNKTKCDSIIYKIKTINNETINIESNMNCNGKTALSLEGVLSLKDNELFYKDKKVGTLNGQQFNLQIKDHHHSIEVSGSIDDKKVLHIIEIHTYRPLPDYFYTVEAELHSSANSKIR